MALCMMKVDRKFCYFFRFYFHYPGEIYPSRNNKAEEKKTKQKIHYLQNAFAIQVYRDMHDNSLQ